MELDLDRVRTNARLAETEDLLDRVTVYREGMEAEALPILEAELRARGVSGEEMEDHAARRLRQGVAAGVVAEQCSFCSRPAVQRGWSWHRLWGAVPLFPRVFRWCAEHPPK